MGHDAKRIDTAVAPLIGLPLWASNRAADLQSFQFGDRHVVEARFGPRKGTKRQVGTYALHLQCEWRITGSTTIASTQMSNHERDEAVRTWLHGRTYVVEAARSDSNGGLRVELSDAFVLEVLGSASDLEHWRLLQPARDLPHFVVGGEDCYTRSATD